jgi:hypothetical protein
LLLPTPSSRAETLADIEGLSVVINWTQRVTGENETGRYIYGDSSWSHRYYVSSKGNLFDYPAVSNRINPGPQIYAIGATKDLGDGYAVSWSMTDGHLTGIAKFPQGSSDLIISIDPSHLTCALEFRRHYDPQTGFMTPRTPAGVLKLREIDTLSSSCAVQRGNIFATD